MSRADLSTRSLGFFLKRAQHRFRTRIDNSLRPLKLTAPQYAVLTAVEADAGISSAKLARLAFVAPQTMQEILANLERAGLLTRLPHPQHGRVLCSALTKPGQKLLGKARQRVEEIEHILAEAVGQKNVIQFAEMLTRCAERLSSE